MRASDTRRKRRDLAASLGAGGEPVSIPQILADSDELKQSSVYRNLAALEHAGVVRRVATDEEYGRYELAEELIGHHHHLVCSNCGTMRDVEVPADLEETLGRHARSDRQARRLRSRRAPARSGRALRGTCASV